MKKLTYIAVGTSFAASMVTGVANAVENPFAMTELESGYQIAMSTLPEGTCGSKDGEAKCGEGKCGGV